MLKKILCAVLIMTSGSLAMSADFFDGAKPRPIKYGEPIAATDTIGGYAVYPGDGHWTFVSSREGSATTGAGDNIPMGTVQMMQLESRSLLARQTITANLGAGPGTSWSGSPCSTGHLVSRNQGRGRYDNCMTIDAINLTVDNVPVLFFSIVLTNTGTNARYYKVVLDLNPALLDMRGTIPADWTPEVLATREHQEAFLKKLSAWAETLQDRSNKAFDYSQPQDAFADIFSFRKLSPMSTLTAEVKRSPSSSNPEKGTEQQGSIEVIPFKLGDNIQTVKNALKTTIDPTPTESTMPVGSPNPNAGKSNLNLRTKGVKVFFNTDGIVESIRLSAPFAGSIAGVKIGDTEKKVLDLKGKPLLNPWLIGKTQAFKYVLDDTANVRFEISEINGVEAISINR